jgi:RND family efflux transporter MFP subunit
LRQHELNHNTNHVDESSRVPVHCSPNTGRTIAVSVVAVAMLLIVGFWLGHHRKSGAADALLEKTEQETKAEAPVDVVTVAYSPSGATLDLPAEARALYESTIYARVSGYIGKWYADIGAKVKKGDVLAEIQTPETDDLLKAAKAKVILDQALIAVAQAQEELAKTTDARWARAMKGSVPLQEQDEKKAEYASTSARTKAAEAQRELDEAEVNRLKDLTDFQLVRAPYDGVITVRRVDIGDLVTAGSSSSNTQLYDIVQSDRIRVFVQVPQAASTDIHVGMPATATAREDLGKKF